MDNNFELAKYLINGLHASSDKKIDEPIQPETQVGPTIRLAKNWSNLEKSRHDLAEFYPLPEEISEAFQIVRTIRNIARYGYQIPAFSLARVVESSNNQIGEFSGLVFQGMQVSTLSIQRAGELVSKTWGNEIEQFLPNVNYFEWCNQVFTSNKDLNELIPESRDNTVTIFRKPLVDKNKTVSVLSIPAINSQHYGYPPYSQPVDARPNMALTYINFDSPESRMLFEESLMQHKTPLRVQNAIHSVLFSLDVTKNLAAVNNRNGLNILIRDGKAQQPWYQSDDVALEDFAGLGFNLRKSVERGHKPTKLV